MSNDRRRDLYALPLAGALLLALPSLAWAQTSGSLILASSYEARGVLLSNQPVVQLRVEHDLDNGWYAGGFASPVMLGGSATQAELIVYAGRAQRFNSGLSWDAGASRTLFLRDDDYGYTELYAGVALDRASARLFLSPDYFGMRSAYLDLNAFHPLGERFRLVGHAGLRHAFGSYHSGSRDNLDLRVGVAYDLGRWSAQVNVGTLQKTNGEGLVRTRQLSASISLRF